MCVSLSFSCFTSGEKNRPPSPLCRLMACMCLDSCRYFCGSKNIVFKHTRRDETVWEFRSTATWTEIKIFKFHHSSVLTYSSIAIAQLSLLRFEVQNGNTAKWQIYTYAKINSHKFFHTIYSEITPQLTIIFSHVPLIFMTAQSFWFTVNFMLHDT
jgi:hypothetical protein